MTQKYQLPRGQFLTARVVIAIALLHFSFGLKKKVAWLLAAWRAVTSHG
jgi:hypothetical protein